MPPLIAHTTPSPDLDTPPAAAIVAVQPLGDEPPPLPVPSRGGGPAPVASLPALPRKIGPNLLGLGALAAFVGVPAVGNATDLTHLPPELGAWGLVAYGLVRVVQELMVWRRENAQDTHAREEAARLRAEVSALREEVRRRDEREDAAREAALQEALAEVKRLRG